MRKLVLAGLAGLGFASLAPTTASAAIFSIAPAVQAAGEQSIDQASPVEEVRTTTGSSSSTRNRSRHRNSGHSSRSRSRGTTTASR